MSTTDRPPVATAEPTTSEVGPPPPSRQPRRPSWHSRPIGYMPALDGLRAVAVALVIAYHLGYSGVAGGYIGVEVFFILSGWLVCALLVNEHQRTGGIALAGFWLRRARRLLPAMVAVIAGTLLVASVVDPGRLAELRTQAFAAVTYHLNWRLIVDQQSYFEAAEGPSALEHLWSLSIEEQFYLFFPLLAAGVLAQRTRVLGGAAGAGPGRSCRRSCASSSTSRGPTPPASTSAPTPACRACCSVWRSACSGRPTACAPTPPGGSPSPWTWWRSPAPSSSPGTRSGSTSTGPPAFQGGLHRRPAGHARGAGRGRLPGADDDRPPAVERGRCGGSGSGRTAST